MNAGEVEDQRHPGPLPGHAAEAEDQAGQGDDEQAADQADEGGLLEMLAGQRRRAVLVFEPQADEQQESDARQQQQVDQIEGFGEDSQVLPGLFFLETEIIVRKWP